MRTENISRLTYFKTNIADATYLHYKPLFKDIKNAIDLHAEGKLLDIGCGNKPYEPLFNKVTQYIGCDVVQSSENKVDVICESTSLPFSDNEFDTVFSTQVMEHVEDHLTMLREAYRVLKSNGKIILSAPMVWNHHEVPYDFFRFTRYGMIYLFEKAGFKIINVKANGGKWAMLGQMMQNITRSSTQNKKSIGRKLLWLLYRFVIKYVINIFFGLLEKIDPDEEFITLNFIVTAEKR